MKKIALLTNFNIDTKAQTAFDAAREIAAAGATPVFPYFVKNGKDFAPKLKGLNAGFASPEEMYRISDIICVIGGDGSVIESAKRASEYGKPLLCINRGRIGFIAELEPDELGEIHRIIEGDCYKDERFMLRAAVIRGGKEIFSGVALNEAIINNGNSLKIVDLRIREGIYTAAQYRADGIIIATPTGSTAYSLSAGGPVIDTRLECFCITPMCPHSPAARPMVFPGTSRLTFESVGDRNPETRLVIDGRSAFSMETSDTVIIEAYDKRACFLRVKPRKHYQGLCKKLDSAF